MKTMRVCVAAVALIALVGLAGCAAASAPAVEDDGLVFPTPTVTPEFTVETGDLEGEEYTIAVGEAMSIAVDGDPDVYRAIMIDAGIAEFYAGNGDLQPTIVGVAPGTTDVVIGDPSGEGEDIAFTVVVTD